jgi:dethiobiotin synthetase
MNRLIVAGIGTEVGKTVASAALVQKLGADYWKPVQAGDLHFTDTHKIQAWVTHPQTVCHPEAYRLLAPMSPHAAAAQEGIAIQEEKLLPPKTENRLVIELAGGLMVPLRHDWLNIDFIAWLGHPVVLVSRYYLGSINHTLLSLYLLKQRQIPIAGIIFNGEEVKASREAILAQHPDVPVLGTLSFDAPPSAEMIKRQAENVHI